MKKSFFPAMAVIALVLLLTHPALSFKGASRGLLLWYKTVLPTLLPFMICSGLIVSLGGIRLLTAPVRPVFKRLFGMSDAGCYVMVSGLLCGYPMGAKTCGEFVDEGRISPSEGRYLLSVSNHPSPMFLLGYAAPAAGAFLPVPLMLAAIYLPLIPMAFLSRQIYGAGENSAGLPDSRKNRQSFDQSMMNSFEVMIKIGGYIMLFSILAEFVEQIQSVSPEAKACLLGIVEITTGIRALSRTLTGIPLGAALCFVSAFGGLCGLFQTRSVLKSPRLSISHYLLWKLLHGCLSMAVFTLLAYMLLPGR